MPASTPSEMPVPTTSTDESSALAPVESPSPSLPDPPGSVSAENQAGPLFSSEPQPVDPKHIPVTRISSWIVSAIFILSGSIAVIIVTVATWPPGLPTLAALGGWILLTAGFAWLAQFWPAIVYRHLRYIVTETGMEIRRGVIWRTVISLPQARVQHTDVVQGPLQRRYGIATLVAHTAGTRNSTVTLEGLSRERAMQIRDFLLQGESDDSV